jgi:hypothetical protein
MVLSSGWATGPSRTGRGLRMTTLAAAFSARLDDGRSDPFRTAAVKHVAMMLRNGAPNVGATVQPFAWTTGHSFGGRLWSYVGSMDAVAFQAFCAECEKAI